MTYTSIYGDVSYAGFQSDLQPLQAYRMQVQMLQPGDGYMSSTFIERMSLLTFGVMCSIMALSVNDIIVKIPISIGAIVFLYMWFYYFIENIKIRRRKHEHK